MNELSTKHLISKLTGVNLLPRKLTLAMADVMGANFLRNRKLMWKEYHQGDQMGDCPVAMKNEIEKIMSDFQTQFTQSMGQMPLNTDNQLIFAYYAEDPAIPANKLAALQQHPRFAEFQEATEFINSHGLRLWMSPNGMHNYVARTGRRGDLNAVNGSNKYFENFGYAWGARKSPVNRNIRQSNFIPAEKVNEIFSDPEQLDELEQSGKRIVKVVTAQKNGAWGVFFTDNTQLFPVIGDNYYAQAKTNEGSSDLADKGLFAATKGQHRKFFGYKTDAEGRGKVFTLPTQTQFILNDMQDSRPKPVHKGTGEMAGIDRGNRFYLWVKNDSTLWWLPSSNAKAILSGQGKPTPLTKEQTDYFNLEKDQYFVLTNPDKFVYSWDTIDPVQKQSVEDDYRYKTDIMNRLYDALMEINPNEQPHVGLNAFKYVVIGPAFKQGSNYDEQQTTGNLPYSTTYLGDQNALGTRQPGAAIVKRQDWAVVGDEFNTAKAQSSGVHGFQVAQSIDGLGPLSGFPTLESALMKAFRTWEINAPFPNQNVIQNAQETFNQVHGVPKQQENFAPETTGFEGNTAEFDEDTRYDEMAQNQQDLEDAELALQSNKQDRSFAMPGMPRNALAMTDEQIIKRLTSI